MVADVHELERVWGPASVFITGHFLSKGRKGVEFAGGTNRSKPSSSMSRPDRLKMLHDELENVGDN